MPNQEIVKSVYQLLQTFTFHYENVFCLQIKIDAAVDLWKLIINRPNITKHNQTFFSTQTR